MVGRKEAFALLQEHARGDVLIRHATAVEACMRAYAQKYSEDENLWSITGLLHDFDWDVCPSPEEHPQFGAEILRERGYPVRSLEPYCPMGTTLASNVKV